MALPSPESTAIVVVEAIQTSGLVPVVISAPGGFSMTLPAVVVDAGEKAGRSTFEFFIARVPNPNTR
ncbi:MAG: hypothetical protein M3O50_04540 [Myxococcota bacterium]|nr:hypothetical protein [Myxococcota bacterium]